MRLIRNLGGMVVLAVLISSCFKAPEFPVEPSITFNNIEFIDVANQSSPDSLILTINFTDGDGDLGLSETDPSDVNYPYNDKFYFTLQGDPVASTTYEGVFVDTSQLIQYHSRTLPGLDTLPLYVPPYKCRNWEVVYDRLGQAKDTLYFQRNPGHFNFFVDILVQQPDNSFKVFDWATELPDNCDDAGFYGRFPILSNDLSQRTAEEGKIRYVMKSQAWNIFFSIKVLQLRVWIQDRAFHKSNVILTKEFQLTAI